MSFFDSGQREDLRCFAAPGVARRIERPDFQRVAFRLRGSGSETIEPPGSRDYEQLSVGCKHRVYLAVDPVDAVPETVIPRPQRDRFCGTGLDLVRLAAHVDYRPQRLALRPTDSGLADRLLTEVVALGVDLRVDDEPALGVAGHEPTAGDAAVPGVAERELRQLAGFEVEEGGKRPAAGHHESVALDEAVTLRCGPAKRRGPMRMR